MQNIVLSVTCLIRSSSGMSLLQKHWRLQAYYRWAKCRRLLIAAVYGATENVLRPPADVSAKTHVLLRWTGSFCESSELP